MLFGHGTVCFVLLLLLLPYFFFTVLLQAIKRRKDNNKISGYCYAFRIGYAIRLLDQHIMFCFYLLRNLIGSPRFHWIRDRLCD